MTNEDIIFNCNPFAYKSMALHSYIIAYLYAFLDFYKSPNHTVITYLAAIEVYKVPNLSIFSNFTIFNNFVHFLPKKLFIVVNIKSISSVLNSGKIGNDKTVSAHFSVILKSPFL